MDEPRPGRTRTVTDAQVEEVIVHTLETTRKDVTHWSTRWRLGAFLSRVKAVASSAPQGDVRWRWSLARRPENASRVARCKSR